MLLSLNYGRSELALEIPEKNLLAYRRPPFPDANATSDPQKILLGAINEFGILRISPIFAGRQVGVIIEDTTHTELLAIMLPFLRSARFVQFLIVPKGHNLNSASAQQIIDALHAMIADFDFPDYDIHANDRETAEFVEIGRTARGTPVQVHEHSAQCDIFLAIADLQNHEFCGYATPLQNFLPGLCSSETLTRHESLACDERATVGQHVWHPDSQRRNNPLADDTWEGVQMILRRRSVLALTVISSHGQLHWAKIGAMIEVTRAGIEKVDSLMRFTLPLADYLIVSPGGFPDDENFYTAQRALTMAKKALAVDGEILFLAHCENGIGSQHFHDTLTKPLAETLEPLKNNDKLEAYRVYQFAQMIQQLRAIHVYSSLPNAIITAMHLHACADPQTLVNQWLAKNSEAQISVVDGARQLAIYPAQNSGDKI